MLYVLVSKQLKTYRDFLHFGEGALRPFRLGKVARLTPKLGNLL